MSPDRLLLAGLIVFGGFVVRGFTGFGAVLFILPLLALWLPMKEAVPLLAVLGAANGAWLAWRCRRQVDRRELGLLLAGALPGMLLGMAVFQAAPDSRLRQALGAVLVLLGLRLAGFRRTDGPKWPPVAGAGVGLSAGFLGALFGVSGPPPVAYLTRQGLESMALRATVLFFILAVDGCRALGYAVGGTLDGPLWLTGAALLPASLLGSWCGERLQARVAEKTFRHTLALLLLATGLVFLIGSGPSPAPPQVPSRPSGR